MKDKIQILYNEILEQVEQLGEVRSSDNKIIRQLAFNLYTVQECEKILLDEGFTVLGPHGKKENPAVGVKNKAEGKIREAYVLLGIDFASQLKKQAANEGNDEWGDFL